MPFSTTLPEPLAPETWNCSLNIIQQVPDVCFWYLFYIGTSRIKWYMSMGRISANTSWLTKQAVPQKNKLILPCWTQNWCNHKACCDDVFEAVTFPLITMANPVVLSLECIKSLCAVYFCVSLFKCAMKNIPFGLKFRLLMQYKFTNETKNCLKNVSVYNYISQNPLNSRIMN